MKVVSSCKSADSLAWWKLAVASNFEKMAGKCLPNFFVVTWGAQVGWLWLFRRILCFPRMTAVSKYDLSVQPLSTSTVATRFSVCVAQLWGLVKCSTLPEELLMAVGWLFKKIVRSPDIGRCGSSPSSALSPRWLVRNEDKTRCSVRRRPGSLIIHRDGSSYIQNVSLLLHLLIYLVVSWSNILTTFLSQWPPSSKLYTGGS